MLQLDDEVAVHRLSLEDVQRMYETGILHPEARVELLDGVLVDMTPPTPEHSSTVEWLARHFIVGCPDAAVRVQDTLLVAGGFVVPDLIVAEPFSRDRLPETALLVVEVAVTSLRHDTRKARRYARAGVGEYWLVDAAARVVRVHRESREDRYAQVAEFRDGASIPAPAGAPPVDVSELLGPPV